MEPLAAIGLSSNILQFIELTAKLVSTTKQIAGKGAKQENIEIEAIAQQLRSLAETIAWKRSDSTFSDDALKELCKACLTITDELLPVLDSLKVEDNATTWRSIQQGLRTMWKADKIEALQKRLDRIGNALKDHMLISQQSLLAQKMNQVAAENHRLEANRDEDIKALKGQIQKAFVDLGTELDKKKEDRDEEISLSTILALAGMEAQYAAEHLILGKLWFQGIDERYEGVKAAHRKTFTWVFKGNATSGGKGIPSFVDWLASDDDLYWISGKPGSGKSTLMKYLCEHDKTAKLLSLWAGGHLLITANFFFWSAAKRSILKSQEGLLRSLLYQILRWCPDLISQAYPQIQQIQSWKMDGRAATAATAFGFPRAPTHLPALLSALRTVCDKLRTTNTKLCFFIDGLDEYEGRPADIIQLIQTLRTLPNLKLCISSRPWNEFEHSFGQDRPHKLYMETLNRPDIQRYVNDIFMSDASYRTFLSASVEGSQLVDEIIEHSQGVFLWVVLVAMSFQEGLINGDRVEDLRKRLRDLPSDLNVYFEKILLADVDQFYRIQSSRMFQAAVAAHDRLPLGAFWFLGADRDDPGFDPDLQPLTVDQWEARRLQLEKILNACCKGLLEVHRKSPLYKRQADYDTGDFEVDFLHRTVRDFLLTPETRATLASWDQRFFSPDYGICHALLAQLKIRPKTEPSESFDQFRFHNIMFFSHCRDLNDHLDCDVAALEQLIDGYHDMMMKLVAEDVWRYDLDIFFGLRKVAGSLLRELTGRPDVQLALVCVGMSLTRYLTRKLDTEVKRGAFGHYLSLLLRLAVLKDDDDHDENTVKTLLECGLNPSDPVTAYTRDAVMVPLSNWEHLILDIWRKDVKDIDRHDFRLVQILLEHGVRDPDAIIASEKSSCQEMLRKKLPPEWMALIEHYFPKIENETEQGNTHHLISSSSRGPRWRRQSVRNAIKRFRQRW